MKTDQPRQDQPEKPDVTAYRMNGARPHPQDPAVLAHPDGTRWSTAYKVNGWAFEVELGGRTDRGRTLLATPIGPDGTRRFTRPYAVEGGYPPDRGRVAEALDLFVDAGLREEIFKGGPAGKAALLLIDDLLAAVTRAAYYDRQIIPDAPGHIYDLTELAEAVANRPAPVIIEADDGHGTFALPEVGDQALLYGDRKIGKSLAALWVTRRVAEADVGVLYIYTEQGGLTQRRILDYIPSGLPVLAATAPLPEQITEWTRRAEDAQVGLVVLDVLSPMMADENANADYNRMLTDLAPLFHQRAGLVVHHLGKDKTRGARGASRIMDAPGIIYRVKGRADTDSGCQWIHVECEEHNGGPDHRPTGITLQAANDDGRLRIRSWKLKPSPGGQGGPAVRPVVYKAAQRQAQAEVRADILPGKSRVGPLIPAHYKADTGTAITRQAAEAALDEELANPDGTLMLVPGAGHNQNGGIAIRSEWEQQATTRAAAEASAVVAEAEAATAQAATDTDHGPNDGAGCDCGQPSCDYCGH